MGQAVAEKISDMGVFETTEQATPAEQNPVVECSTQRFPNKAVPFRKSSSSGEEKTPEKSMSKSSSPDPEQNPEENSVSSSWTNNTAPEKSMTKDSSPEAVDEEKS